MRDAHAPMKPCQPLPGINPAFSLEGAKVGQHLPLGVLVWVFMAKQPMADVGPSVDLIPQIKPFSVIFQEGIVLSCVLDWV